MNKTESAINLVGNLCKDLIQHKRGKHFIHAQEYLEVINSYSFSGYINPVGVFTTIFGIPLLPVEDGFILWKYCDYCGSTDIPVKGYCEKCGAPL